MKRVSDEELVSALLTNSGNQVETAKALGISPVTVCNRLKGDKAKELIAQHRCRIVETTSNELVSLNSEAVRVLSDILSNSDNEYVRMCTAFKILAFTKEYITIADICKRLDELEKN